jgi:hypothetical protein
LICNANYTGTSSNEISFSVNIDNINLLGDLNYDGEINILDVILAVDMILHGEFNSLVDLNQDQNLNISDIILLINLILD